MVSPCLPHSWHSCPLSLLKQAACTLTVFGAWTETPQRSTFNQLQVFVANPVRKFAIWRCLPEAKGSDLCRPQNAQHLEMFGQDENVSVISCWQTIFPNRFPQLPGLAARGAFSVSPSADTSRAQRDEIKTAGPGRPRHSQTDGNWCCEPLGNPRTGHGGWNFMGFSRVLGQVCKHRQAWGTVAWNLLCHTTCAGVKRKLPQVEPWKMMPGSSYMICGPIEGNGDVPVPLDLYTHSKDSHRWVTIPYSSL